MIREFKGKMIVLENWGRTLGLPITNIIFFFIIALLLGLLTLFFPPRNALLITFLTIYLVFVFIYPFFGIYGYYLIELVAPQTLVWSNYPRMALINILFTGIVGVLYIAKTKLNFIWTKQHSIIIALWTILIFSTIFAYNREVALYRLWNSYSKAFIFYFISIILIRSKNQYLGAVWLFTAIFAFLGLYGTKAYISGAKYLCGIGGKFATDNIFFGMIMVIGLPFVFYPFLTENKLNLRRKLCILTFFPATIMTIICTYSRGAFLGMIGVLIIMFLKANNKMKLLVLGCGLFLIPFLPFILPEEYRLRMSTISTYKEDGSAMERIEAWQAGFGMIRDYPLTGVGPDNFGLLSDLYNPQVDVGRVAHNAFIEMTAENGIPALIFFFLLIGISLLDLHDLRKKTKISNKNLWVIHHTHMLECAFYGYLICAMFISVEGMEVLYYLIGLTVMLKNIIKI